MPRRSFASRERLLKARLPSTVASAFFVDCDNKPRPGAGCCSCVHRPSSQFSASKEPPCSVDEGQDQQCVTCCVGANLYHFLSTQFRQARASFLSRRDESSFRTADFSLAASASISVAAT